MQTNLCNVDFEISAQTCAKRNESIVTCRHCVWRMVCDSWFARYLTAGLIRAPQVRRKDKKELLYNLRSFLKLTLLE